MSAKGVTCTRTLMVWSHRLVRCSRGGGDERVRQAVESTKSCLEKYGGKPAEVFIINLKE